MTTPQRLVRAIPSTRTKSPAPAPEQAPATPAPTRVAESAKWACTADTECMNSCKHGAVNVTWYAEAKPAECHDGCANQLADPPRCIAGGCVAFRHDPRDGAKIEESPECTRRE